MGPLGRPLRKALRDFGRSLVHRSGGHDSSLGDPKLFLEQGPRLGEQLSSTSSCCINGFLLLSPQPLEIGCDDLDVGRHPEIVAMVVVAACVVGLLAVLAVGVRHVIVVGVEVGLGTLLANVVGAARDHGVQLRREEKRSNVLQVRRERADPLPKLHRAIRNDAHDLLHRAV